MNMGDWEMVMGVMTHHDTNPFLHYLVKKKTRFSRKVRHLCPFYVHFTFASSKSSTPV